MFTYITFTYISIVFLFLPYYRKANYTTMVVDTFLFMHNVPFRTKAYQLHNTINVNHITPAASSSLVAY